MPIIYIYIYMHHIYIYIYIYICIYKFMYVYINVLKLNYSTNCLKIHQKPRLQAAIPRDNCGNADCLNKILN